MQSPACRELGKSRSHYFLEKVRPSEYRAERRLLPATRFVRAK
jgi:hypothetical protein